MPRLRGYLAVAVLKGVFNYGQNYLMNYVGNQVIGDIREQLFSKLVRLPVHFHDTNTSGRLVSRVINDVNQMANAVVYLFVSIIVSFLQLRILQRREASFS